MVVGTCREVVQSPRWKEQMLLLRERCRGSREAEGGGERLGLETGTRPAGVMETPSFAMILAGLGTDGNIYFFFSFSA